MSWNVLAAELAHTHAGELYPQAPEACLAWPGRLAAVVRHVGEQRPDVLCLQEVDDWPGIRSALARLGYDGVHVQRTGGRGDGCATLWRKDRLCLADRRRARSGSADAASGSKSDPTSGSVHKIRMADHGLRDNVALLVHLRPRTQSGEAVGGGTDGGRRSTAAGSGAELRASRDAQREEDEEAGEPSSSGNGGGNATSTSGVSGDGDGADGMEADAPADRSAAADSRRVKRSRSGSGADAFPARRSGAGSSGAAATAASSAAAAAMAGLRPPSRSGSGVAATPHSSGAAAAAAPAVCRLPGRLRRGFWVANTHVLFNTKRGDIKLGQLRVILTELAARAGVDAAPQPQQQQQQQQQQQVQQHITVGGAENAAAASAVGCDAAAAGPGLQRSRSRRSSRSALDAAAAAAAEGDNEPRARDRRDAGPLPCIFAGDFNAAPGSGLHRFLRGGLLELGGEDRRELSGQVEGYGYSSLQRDVRSGRPPQLARWGPPPPPLLQQQTQPQGMAASAPARQPEDPPLSAAGSGSADQWQRHGSRGNGQQESAAPSPYTVRRQYAVRWDMEELVNAMGRAAVTAMTAVAAPPPAGPAATSLPANISAPAGRRSNGGGAGGDFRIPQALASTPSQPPLPPTEQQPGQGQGRSPWPGSGPGRGPGRGQGRGNGGPPRDAWPSLADSAVVRHPLALRSAYAAVDPAGREPLFTTLHARYVGTVDFVWYTPGDAGAGGEASRGAGYRASGGTGAGFSLTPLRVLHPPDPLSYTYGMPCPGWPSDHVSLVVDFRLR